MAKKWRKMAKSIALWRNGIALWRNGIALWRRNGEENGEVIDRSLAKWNRSLAKNRRRNGEENGEILRFEYMITLGLLSGFFYSYLHKILIYSFSHIDLSFLAHLVFVVVRY